MLEVPPLLCLCMMLAANPPFFSFLYHPYWGGNCFSTVVFIASIISLFLAELISCLGHLLLAKERWDINFLNQQIKVHPRSQAMRTVYNLQVLEVSSSWMPGARELQVTQVCCLECFHRLVGHCKIQKAGLDEQGSSYVPMCGLSYLGLPWCLSHALS